MAFVVQDDTGTIAGANSYTTTAFIETYAADRGVELTESGAALEPFAVVGSDYVDRRFLYLGERLTSGQTTEFPRLDLYDRDQRLVQGIPIEVPEAVAEYVIRVDALVAAGGSTQDLLADPAEQGSSVRASKVKLGSLEVDEEFSASTGNLGHVLPVYPAADLLLKRRGFVAGSAVQNLVRG